MSLKRTAAAFETSETARSVQKRPDDADDVSGGRLEAEFASAVAGDAMAQEEAAQKILKRKVRKVDVRKPSGQEGCVKLNTGQPFKLSVGYHEIRQFVAGADANFLHRTFYLDVRGFQTDTSLPPALPCVWGGCKGNSKYHWSIDCPEVRRQMVGHIAHDLRLCWPAPPLPPLSWQLAPGIGHFSPKVLYFTHSGWCPQSAPRNRRPRTVRQLPLGGSTPSQQPPRPRSSYTSLRVHLVTAQAPRDHGLRAERRTRQRLSTAPAHNREIHVV
jgi:hypothetical protein